METISPIANGGVDRVGVSHTSTSVKNRATTGAKRLTVLDRQQIVARRDTPTHLPIRTRERVELVGFGVSAEPPDPVSDDPHGRGVEHGADRRSDLRREAGKLGLDYVMAQRLTQRGNVTDRGDAVRVTGDAFRRTVGERDP